MILLRLVFLDERTALHLLYALAGLRKFYSKHYSLTAVTVDLGYPDFKLMSIKELCQELVYHIILFPQKSVQLQGTE